MGTHTIIAFPPLCFAICIFALSHPNVHALRVYVEGGRGAFRSHTRAHHIPLLPHTLAHHLAPPSTGADIKSGDNGTGAYMDEELGKVSDGMLLAAIAVTIIMSLNQ